jgi:hypothetical protein
MWGYSYGNGSFIQFQTFAPSERAALARSLSAVIKIDFDWGGNSLTSDFKYLYIAFLNITIYIRNLLSKGKS